MAAIIFASVSRRTSSSGSILAVRCSAQVASAESPPPQNNNNNNNKSGVGALRGLVWRVRAARAPVDAASARTRQRRVFGACDVHRVASARRHTSLPKTRFNDCRPRTRPRRGARGSGPSTSCASQASHSASQVRVRQEEERCRGIVLQEAQATGAGSAWRPGILRPGNVCRPCCQAERRSSGKQAIAAVWPVWFLAVCFVCLGRVAACFVELGSCTRCAMLCLPRAHVGLLTLVSPHATSLSRILSLGTTKRRAPTRRSSR